MTLVENLLEREPDVLYLFGLCGSQFHHYFHFHPNFHCHHYFNFHHLKKKNISIFSIIYIFSIIIIFTIIYHDQEKIADIIFVYFLSIVIYNSFSHSLNVRSRLEQLCSFKKYTLSDIPRDEWNLKKIEIFNREVCVLFPTFK